MVVVSIRDTEDKDPNCYTLVHSSIERFISLTGASRVPSVELGMSEPFVRAQLCIGRDVEPVHRDRMLVSAAPVRRGKYIWLRSRGDWNGVLLRVTSRNLDFGFEPLVSNANLYAGVWGQSAIVSVGRANDPEERDQLIALTNGEFVLVTDRRGAVAMVTCRDGCLEMVPAPPEVIGAWVVRYCRTKTKDRVRTADWGIGLLRALNLPGFADELGRYRNGITRR